MSINRVIITGNLTRDPELNRSAAGMAILKMGVAVNDRRKNSTTGEWEDSVNFVDVTMFGTRAEAVSRFLSKGKSVGIADDIELFGGPRDGGSGRSEAPAYAEPTADTPPGEDIPF